MDPTQDEAPEPVDEGMRDAIDEVLRKAVAMLADDGILAVRVHMNGFLAGE